MAGIASRGEYPRGTARLTGPVLSTADGSAAGQSGHANGGNQVVCVAIGPLRIDHISTNFDSVTVTGGNMVLELFKRAVSDATIVTGAIPAAQLITTVQLPASAGAGRVNSDLTAVPFTTRLLADGERLCARYTRAGSAGAVVNGQVSVLGTQGDY